MKIKNLAMTALLACATGVFVTNTAKATLTYADGNLLLGFRATGGSSVTTDYVLNLGSFVQFTTGALVDGQVHTLSLSGIGTDLSAQYGNDWFTNSTTGLLWGIAGTQKAAGNGVPLVTIFMSEAESINGTQATPWSRQSSSAQNTTAGKMTVGAGNQGGVYVTGTATANNALGTFQSTSTVGSWASQMAGGVSSTAGAAYSNYGDVNGTGVEAILSNSSSNVLDLYEMQFSSTGGAGAYLGSFRMESNGNVDFSSSAAQFAVPEPSSVALMAAGCAGLLAWARRRSNCITKA